MTIFIVLTVKSNKFCAHFHFDKSVIQAGFEPTTHALEGRCSIQLSYGTILNCAAKVGTFFGKTKFFLRLLSKPRGKLCHCHLSLVTRYTPL